MKHSKISPDRDSEWDRLSVLHALDFFDVRADTRLEEVTCIAASVFGAASSAISLVEADHLRFAAKYGITIDTTPRDTAFCNEVLLRREPLIISDASADLRFRHNPLVEAEGGIRFYAGAPLLLSSGHCIGALCVFDKAARHDIDPAQVDVLTDLAALVVRLMEAQRLRRMDKIAAQVVAASADAVVAADRTGKIVFWNHAAEVMFRYPAEQALGEDISLIIPPSFAEGHGEMFARAAAGGPTRLVGTAVELIATRADGSEFPIELSLTRWGDTDPEQGFAAIVRNITDRKQLEMEREQAEAFLRNVVSQMPTMLFVKDALTRKYLLINRAGERVIGRPAEEVLGMTDRQLFPEYAEGFTDRDEKALDSRKPEIFESRFIRPDGTPVVLRTTRSVIEGPDGSAQAILGVAEDVTRTREFEAEIMRLARHDILTGLSNRANLTEHIHELVDAGTAFAMLSIDLDRFKAVNDQFGHITGDEVLVQVGERLRGAMGPDDFLARIGGDEFVAIMVGEGLRERAAEVSAAIIERLGEPFVTERATAYCGASVGIVLHPDDGRSPEQLRENADLALYRAKQHERGTACVFDEAMDVAARDRRKLEADLRVAVREKAVTLAYQPVLSTSTGQITSCEALARWMHPVRGPISPQCFVEVAEECGLIDTMGENLLRQACLDALSWPPSVRVAVNLSALQFNSEKLPETVAGVLADTGFDARRLQLEVTESVVITDVDRTFRQLEELRGLGMQILMDDFGVGCSSLSYFQRFRFDKVKLDKSFVQDITSRESRAIVEAVVGLGQKLSMGIVAEGVETEQQMRMLVASGCTHLQGYLFGRAMPANLIAEVLKAGASGHTEGDWCSKLSLSQ